MIELVDAVPDEERIVADWGCLGRAQFYLGRWTEARESLERSIAVRGDTVPTTAQGPRWWYLVMTLHHLGEVDQAREYYEQLVAEFDEQPVTAQLHVRAEVEALLEIPGDGAP